MLRQIALSEKADWKPFPAFAPFGTPSCRSRSAFGAWNLRDKSLSSLIVVSFGFPRTKQIGPATITSFDPVQTKQFGNYVKPIPQQLLGSLGRWSAGEYPRFADHSWVRRDNLLQLNVDIGNILNISRRDGQ